MVLEKRNINSFCGIAASPGIVMGKLKVVDRRHLHVEEYPVTPGGVAAEIERLKEAIRLTQVELEAIKGQLQKTTGDEHLFFIDTHLLILSDERLLAESIAIIENSLINAEAALQRTLHHYREIFAGIDDA